ncbi:MAG: hypothetical protein D6721_07210 [Gammaproteobacteria bacterium]|nr:MAG: hypothetical protein D6721_07210 [Gammaproteobacteria bacterium]
MALAAAGIELRSLTPSRAVFRFTGPFEGREVRWEARLRRLAPDSRAPQYLEVGRPEAGCVPIEIGLRIPRVDRAAVLKTVIMVRNYRRLRTGRHEWNP